ncbi:MAG: 2-C-methyl-D-erythritol 2,4-cyclodiphosphate synthase [Deltaproteobacteria bacterium]|nr:2-C-methyl-D-erythritol 2,4-cyclodiphosphate synthase [Deltaproteobacteria bacterium]MBW2121036.1 2-C-methyl-D-erythritol 2,4-cyclodiphosphate synthase [Deltaproteobacteria bacterium]
MRIGWGYDLHPLVEGRALVLGAVKVPFKRGLHGHSDGDALIHAVCDAMLGAMGAGDLGRLFPDTDPKLAGIESSRLLEEIAQKARQRGYRIHNVDATIVAQMPRLADYLPEMELNLAKTLRIDRRKINVKATSPEGIGAIGRGEAIAAQCVVLMEREQSTHDP